MTRDLDIAFFGSSLVSAYWNGAATYYRGLLRALAGRGHRITFYEPDAYGRQQHRDMDDPEWASVVVYGGQAAEDSLHALESARGADLLVKASGVGVHDALLESAVLDHRRSGAVVAFWDVDAPATLDRVEGDPSDAFRTAIPEYDVVFTYGGGDVIRDRYAALGAKRCVPVYNALDDSTHFPDVADSRFAGDLAFLGNRLPDREARVDEFFLRAATLLPDRDFVLAGSGWEDKILPPNVRYIGHVFTHEHNRFNSTPLAVLNVSRESMARTGHSPATRVFEAAGAGACIITDAWDGIESFLEPGREVLVAQDGAQVASMLGSLTQARASRIGNAARERVLAEHTYASRAELVESVLSSMLPAAATVST